MSSNRDTSKPAALDETLKIGTAVAASFTEHAGAQIGPYRLREKIGEGGCGVVYIAEQTEPMRRRVALKVIKLGMDTREVIARFEAERQALAMMDHPNIAKVLDAGSTEQGRPYFVMELVRGIRITDYCDEHFLTTQDRLELFIKVCQAIQHAHQKGIIHRDIKPSNVLVSLHDSVAVPKVIDFGIAKATEGRLTDATIYTQLHQFIGTPAYMSPEQAEMSGLDIDTRSDIYSLGVLLYELLTGKTPFDAGELLASGLDALRKTIRESEPVRPSTKLATLPGDDLRTAAKRRSVDSARLTKLLRGDLDWIVMKCLEKDRARRYDTANGLAADVQRHLNHEAVIARPPSSTYRFQKLVRRNKLMFAAASAVATALLFGIVISSWQAVRARNAERQQRNLRTTAETARAGETAQRLAAQAAQASETELRKLAEAQAYAADMKAAQAALQQNSRQQAVTLLDQYWPKPGEPDLRGIEWRYLWQAAKGNEIYTWKLPGMAPGALFSPNGQHIATACFDGILRVWNVASGSLVSQFDRGVRDDQIKVSFCYSPDGATLAFAARDGILLLDCATWQVKRTLHLPEAERDGVSNVSLTYSPDGRWLAAGFSFHPVRLWNTESWQSATLPTSAAVRVAFSPDSENLTMGVHQEGMLSWHVASRAKLKFEDSDGETWEISQFSPSGDQLVGASSRGNVAVWDVRSRKLLWRERAHRSRIFGLTFSHDGRHFATGGYDQLIHVWDATTREKVNTLQGHLNEIWSLAFSPDDRRLLTSSKDGTVKLWDAQTKPQPNHWMIPVTEEPIGFTHDGRGLITIGDQGRAVHHWSGAQVVKSLRCPSPIHTDWTLFAPGSQSLYVLRSGGEFQVYDAHTLEVRRSFKIRGRYGQLYHLSPDERWVVGRGATDRDLHVWDTTSGESVTHLQDHQEGYGTFHVAVFSPDSKTLAYATDKWEVKLWDIEKRQFLRTLGAHPWRINAITFAPNGRYLASASWEGDVRLFEVATRRELHPPLYGHGSGVHATSFSSDGATLISSGDDHTVRFWNVATGREMLVFNKALSQSFRPPQLSATGELVMWRDVVGDPQTRVELIPTMAGIEKARRAETIAR